MEGSRSSALDSGDEEEKINLFLKIIKIVGLSVKTSETVRNVKAILNEKEGISECIQDLVFSGERLRDDLKLVNCGIRQNSTLTVFVQNFFPLRLFVKIPSHHRNHKIIVVKARSCDIIQDVKSSIMEKEGIQPCNFNLIYAGKVLVDDMTLASLGIQGESTLHVMITPKDTLTISVKRPTREILKMEVRKLWTVCDIKTLVESTGFPVDDLNLAYNGVQLDDSKNLSWYNIAEESILEMVPQNVQVFVKDLYGKTFTIDVYLEDLVTSVKEKIFHKVEIPTDIQRLLFEGKFLVNDRNLASYNIQKDSTLHLSVCRTVVQEFQDGTDETGETDETEEESS